MHLDLMITPDSVKLVAQPPRRGWRSIFGGAETGTGMAPLPPVLVPLEQRGVGQAIEEALDLLGESAGSAVDGCDVSASLGMSTSRVGILSVSKTARANLSEQQIHGWIRQIWAIDPAEQVVRWQADDRQGNVLVSCIDRLAYDGLVQTCNKRKLRLRSCKPALLGMLQEKIAGATGESILVCTEPLRSGRRAGAVQLVHVRASSAVAAWRGWLPTQGSEMHDAGVLGAVQRFAHGLRIAEEVPVHCLHWSQAG